MACIPTMFTSRKSIDSITDQIRNLLRTRNAVNPNFNFIDEKARIHGAYLLDSRLKRYLLHGCPESSPYLNRLFSLERTVTISLKADY
ncbi:hypothetical protein TNCV_406741 [Trichonephila clavipes]|nr:hypothetical protein TNCV_406741 [Trichonephila clavipes]